MNSSSSSASSGLSPASTVSFPPIGRSSEALTEISVALPIPIARAVLDFVKKGMTGSFQVHVKDGRMLSVDVRHSVRA